VKFRNVPSFVHHLDAPVEVKGVGTAVVDVAYGGMNFAMVDAARLGFAITPDEARDICDMGEKLRQAAREQLKAIHPENPEIRGISITQFMGPLKRKGNGLTAKNAVVVSPGRIDRSPCGTGTSARLAVLHARKQIRKGQLFDHTSIIGTHFFAEVVGTTRVGKRPAVVTTVAGRGYLTDIGHYGLDPDDPLPEGYTLADTWLKPVTALQK